MLYIYIYIYIYTYLHVHDHINTGTLHSRTEAIERLNISEDSSLSKVASLNGKFVWIFPRYKHAYHSFKLFLHSCVNTNTGEVESLRVKNQTLRDRKEVHRQEFEESKERVASLRSELKSIEATLDSEKVSYSNFIFNHHHHHHHHHHYHHHRALCMVLI